MEWYSRLSQKGLPVKALDTMPILLDIDHFYWEMYNACGNNVGNIIAYCGLYAFSSDETLEAIKILSGVSHASS